MSHVIQHYLYLFSLGVPVDVDDIKPYTIEQVIYHEVPEIDKVKVLGCMDLNVDYWIYLLIYNDVRYLLNEDTYRKFKWHEAIARQLEEKYRDDLRFPQILSDRYINLVNKQEYFAQKLSNGCMLIDNFFVMTEEEFNKSFKILTIPINISENDEELIMSVLNKPSSDGLLFHSRPKTGSSQ